MPEIDDDDVREVIEGFYRIVYRIRSEALLEVACRTTALRSCLGTRCFRRVRAR